MGIQQTFLRGYGGAVYDWGGDRGVFAGGWVQAQGPQSTNIQYFNIAGSPGATSSSFGNLSLSEGSAYYQGGAMGNGTRALFVGNYNESPADTNERRRIDYVTTATTGNSVDFGDLQANNGRFAGAGISHKTRGLFGGGRLPPASQTTIDYRTIANTGTCQDFGDLTQPRHYISGAQDNTRGVFAGGYSSPFESPVSARNTMDYNTIMTTGNSTDFGDMSSGYWSGRGGVGDTTRGVWLGGYQQSPSVGRQNTIDYITIQTTGNSSDFGDLTRTVAWGFPMGNETRGLYAGGEEPSYNTTIDMVTIQTTGNATDFGDMSGTRASGGCGSGSASQDINITGT